VGLALLQSIRRHSTSRRHSQSLKVFRHFGAQRSSFTTERKTTLPLRASLFDRSGICGSVTRRLRILGILESRGHRTFPLSVRHGMWLSRKDVTGRRQDKS